jgi:hypothetical protein
MKFIYKPFGIIIGILAGMVGRQVFTFIWDKIDDEEAPKPDTEIAPWPKILGAAFVQGATFSIVKAIAKRGSAKGFAHLTGVWPGERRPEPK